LVLLTPLWYCGSRDAPDEDDVVAAVMPVLVTAFEMRCAFTNRPTLLFGRGKNMLASR
jgi:hypothetical protein